MGVVGVGVMVEVRGVLVRPPSLCWGGTVTVMGAVTAGAVRGIGSDTEITTLVGAEGTGLDTVGAVIGGSCTIGVVVEPAKILKRSCARCRIQITKILDICA